MKTRKHQCRVQLAASEPVAYRLVYSCLLLLLLLNKSTVIASAERPRSSTVLLYLHSHLMRTFGIMYFAVKKQIGAVSRTILFTESSA